MFSPNLQPCFFIHSICYFYKKHFSSLIIFSTILIFSLSSFPVLANELIKKDIAHNNSGIFLPVNLLYPNYIANPLRPSTGFQIKNYSETSIIDTSRRRFDLKVGGNIGIYRNQSAKPDRGWQITLGAGFHGEFDPASSEDNIGWDGIIALSVEMRFSPDFAHRIGVHHISSHIGDELIERTGHQRINYTRQEVRYGLMWFMAPHWQSYIEAGRGYDLRNKDLQKRWRGEMGVQFENAKYWSPKLGWYMAADFSGYQESDWAINSALQLAIVSSVNNRSFRLGFEFYDGRSILGEFFQVDEKYAGFGFWIDI